jgi:hypothetical protein
MVGNVTSAWSSDDDALLTAVKEALQEATDVPASFIEAGVSSYAWHNIDAELAALTYDSSRDLLAGASTRAEPAELRCMTFDANHLTIELEIIADALHGQVVPPQRGTIELRHAGGQVTTAEINDVGYFTAVPLPAGKFRLYCNTNSGVAVLTDWITL